MTKRIETLIGEIANVGVLCDVGCDHGYVSFNALNRGNCLAVVLTDISSKSLKKAEKLFDSCNLPYVSYLTDGMNGVVEKIDTAAICGMGGHEIAKILHSKRVQNLILQPMLDVEFLREFLVDNGYSIEKDYIILSENKFYTIIVARIGNGTLTEEEKYFGKDFVFGGEDFKAYLKYREQEIEKILANELPKERKEKVLRILEMIKGGLEREKKI